MTCRRCADRGKTWNGSDPVCGFDDEGVFTSENFACATLLALRQAAIDTDVVTWNDDEAAAVLPEPEHADGRGGGFVLLRWYKMRGRVMSVLLWTRAADDPRPITLAEAERVLDWTPRGALLEQIRRQRT